MGKVRWQKKRRGLCHLPLSLLGSLIAQGRVTGAFRGRLPLLRSELPSVPASLYANLYDLGQVTSPRPNHLLPQYNVCNALYLISGSLAQPF